MEVFLTTIFVFVASFFVLTVGTLWVFDEIKNFVKFAYAFVPLFRATVVLIVFLMIGYFYNLFH